jgi:hypothetical protein
MARTTQRKGDIAVAKAIADFTERGWDVSLPITESASYDLVVDDGNALFRVQVRYWGGQQTWVDLRNTNTNTKGSHKKHRVKDSYDWLYAYRPDDGGYLVTQLGDQKSGFSPKESHRFALNLG